MSTISYSRKIKENQQTNQTDATGRTRDVPAEMRLVEEILRDALTRLCPTFSSRRFIVGSSYLRTPSVRYFVFAVEPTLACAKLAIGKRAKERRWPIAQATEPNICQQSSRFDRAG